MRSFAAVIVLISSAALGQSSAPPPATQPALAIPDQATLGRQFQEMMTGATMVGRATVGRKEDASPREDRYVIQRASKFTDASGEGDKDRWLLVWQAKFRGREIPVPLIVPVKWAGDTPVISVTGLTIPGMGTFTARVMIYHDTYAGTWSGHGQGGHLWGRIERASTTAPAATQSTVP